MREALALACPFPFPFWRAILPPAPQPPSPIPSPGPAPYSAVLGLVYFPWPGMGTLVPLESPAVHVTGR
jgi:hypothetical protein